MSINVHLNMTFAKVESLFPQTEMKTAISAAKVAISNWTSRNGNCFSNLFYRIGQIFMAILGKSDWQFATAKIQEAIIKFATKEANVPNAIFNPKILGLMDKISSKVLEVMVKINDRNLSENTHPKDDKVLSDELTSDLEPFGKEIIKEAMEVVQNDPMLGIQLMQQLKNPKIAALKGKIGNILV